jgi:hypothetical protein
MAKKSNINWYFLILGIIILSLSLSSTSSNDLITPSKQITIELSKDIISVKGRKSEIDYKFWTKAYQNQFNILNGSISRGKHKLISNLKEGQKLELIISKKDFHNLNHNYNNITVRGLSMNGTHLMSQNEFLNNRESYGQRIQIFSIFFATILIINALFKISKKINYILIGTFASTILIMRIFEFGIY